MWRWLNWAARIAATAVLLSFLSIWTTGYIVNSYVESLLKQFDLPLETQPFALSGIWGTLWGGSPVSQSKDEANGESGNPVLNLENLQQSTSSAHDNDGRDGGTNTGNGSSPDRSSGEAEDRGGSAVEGSPTSAPEDLGSHGTGTGQDDAVPVFGGQESTSAMTDEQRQALNAIMSKLNEEQLSELSGYLKDGLTEEELAAVRELLKPSLTASEYAKIMEILAPQLTKPGESTDNSSESQANPPNNIP